MTQRLEYSPPLPWHRRRRYRRGAILLALCVVAVVIWLKGRQIWHRAVVLYYQRQCLTYRTSPNFVAFEPDPSRAAVLLQQPEIYDYSGNLPFPEFAAARVPACLQKLVTILKPTGFYGMSVGFLHERRNRRGERKLVVVAPPSDPRSITYAIADVSSWRGATKTTWITIYFSSAYEEILLGRVDRAPLRVYAGQPDPSDETHFTFRYELDGQPGTIDGYLRDGDDIEFRVRDGPAVKPPRWAGPAAPPSFGEFRSTPPGMDLIDDRPVPAK